MEARSNGPAEQGATFSRARLVLGIVLITVLGAAALVGLSRFAEGPHPGSLVFVAESGVVFLDLATDEQEAALSWDERWSAPALSPDGERLAYASPGGVAEVDLGTGDTRGVAAQGAPVGFGPGGRLVYVRPGDEGERLLFRTGDGGPERLVPGGFRGYEGPVLWISEERYATRFLDPGGASGGLVVVDLSGEEPSVEHTIRAAFPLTLSPDGRELLYATGVPGQLEILDLAELEARSVGFAGELTVGATSPRGVTAVGGRDDAGEPGIWALRGDGGEPERLVDAAPSALAWTLDSSRLLFVDDGTLYETPVPEGGRRGLDVDVLERRFLETVR